MALLLARQSAALCSFLPHTGSQDHFSWHAKPSFGRRAFRQSSKCCGSNGFIVHSRGVVRASQQKDVPEVEDVEAEEALVESRSAPSVLYSTSAALLFALADADSGYSQASYYTSLGLFLMSLPGIWSLVKRSTKSKVVRKTFVVPGPQAVEDARPLDKVASQIASFFKQNNYTIAGTGEVITFEGAVAPSRGQAAFLTFCAALSLASLALVLTITNPEPLGEKWYLITLASPLAGLYYWRRASRKEQVKVKMVTSDDETTTDVVVEGDQEEIERFRRDLQLMEKGMVYVKGILEG